MKNAKTKSLLRAKLAALRVELVDEASKFFAYQLLVNPQPYSGSHTNWKLDRIDRGMYIVVSTISSRHYYSEIPSHVYLTSHVDADLHSGEALYRVQFSENLQAFIETEYFPFLLLNGLISGIV